MSPKNLRDGPRRKAAAGRPEQYELVLYVSGATEHSRRALSNIKSIADKHLKGRYRLAVVDLYQQPARAREQEVIAVPMLVKKLPAPLRKMIGDLSEEEQVLIGLDLVPRVAGKKSAK